ncbi:NAD(P)(+)-binding proteins & short chain dehydrogenase, partial [Metarhizium hybridum]
MVHQSSRIIVVTGASRGLGFEWVRQFSESTENFVIAVVRDAKKAQQSETLSRSNVAIVTADLSKLETFPVVAAEISRLSGSKVDILINNAGVMVGAGASFDQGICKSTPGEWDGQYKLNVTSVVFFTIALLNLLEASKEKKVVNLVSMLGDLSYTFANPDVHFASYAATKAALTMATARFHNEFENKGFTFIALNPGWVNTDLAGEGKGTIVNQTPC